MKNYCSFINKNKFPVECLKDDKTKIIKKNNNCFCRDAADNVIERKGKFEELVVSSHEIAASTAQLVSISCFFCHLCSVTTEFIKKILNPLHALLTIDWCILSVL